MGKYCLQPNFLNTNGDRSKNSVEYFFWFSGSVYFPVRVSPWFRDKTLLVFVARFVLLTQNRRKIAVPSFKSKIRNLSLIETYEIRSIRNTIAYVMFRESTSPSSVRTLAFEQPISLRSFLSPTYLPFDDGQITNEEEDDTPSSHRLCMKR